MEKDNLLLKSAVFEENRKDGRNTSTAFSWPVEKRNGFVFGVLEAKSRSALAQVVMEIARDHFAKLASTIQDNTSIPRRFEQTLEAMNEEIAARSMEMETFLPGQFEAVVGLAVDDMMYLSGSGELFAVFLHKLPEGKYQIFNLARCLQNEQATADWQKIFAVILDGALNPGDVFCVSNHDLQQEMTSEELNSLLVALPPQSSVVKLRQYFPLETELSIFVLKASDDERPAISAPASLKQLYLSREQTTRVLADKKPVFFKKALLKTFAYLKNHRSLRHLLKSLLKLVISSIVITFLMAKDSVSWTARLARRLASSERKEVFTEARSRWEATNGFFRAKLKRLPKTSRYLILAALAVAVVLVIGVAVVSRGREAAAERVAFERAATKIEALINDASSALIYKNETQAHSYLKEAQTLLNAAPANRLEKQKKLEELQSTITNTLNELRRISEVSPEIIASASSLASPVSFSAISLTNGEVFTLGSDRVMYRVDQVDKKFEAVSLDEGVGQGLEASSEEQYSIWLDDRVGLDVYDTAEKKLFVSGIGPSANENWVDLYAYADRVYILSPGSGLSSQIYKISRSGSELGATTSWLKSPTDVLSNAAALAVDGTVFVLRQDGTVVWFISGREATWLQGVVDPPLVSASDVWTSADSAYLYVLDPAGQRLVVYEKETGVLKTQYHSNSFTVLTDFAVDETNKTIYLLGNGNVYKISVSHLK